MRRLLLASLLLASSLGCAAVTKDDYRALFEASKAYRATVSPTFRAEVERAAAAGELAPQSRANRLAADDEFGRALQAAGDFLEGRRPSASAGP